MARSKKRGTASGTAKQRQQRIRLVELTVGGLAHRGFKIFKTPTAYTKAAKVLSVASQPPMDRYVIYNFAHESLFGTRGRKEGYVFNRGKAYVFEAKYQGVGGSVDEKMPYLHECFIVSPVSCWIIMFDGDYWLKHERGRNAVAWLRRKELHNRGCRVDGGQLYIAAGHEEWHALADELFGDADVAAPDDANSTQPDTLREQDLLL